jgi:hypothetical protein
MRNNWGLWTGSRLATYFGDHGVHHPDDMSGIILTAYRRHLLGRAIKFEELCLSAAESEERSKRWEAKANRRAEESNRKLAQMMMDLKYETVPVDTVAIPTVPDWGKYRNRYIARFHHGLLLAMRGLVEDEWVAIKGLPPESPPPDPDDEMYIHLAGPQELLQEFDLTPYYFDFHDRKLHKVSVPELKRIKYAVMVDSVACFAGLSKHGPVVVLTDGHSRKIEALPDTAISLQLGTDGKHLLAIYRTTIFRLQNGQWTKIYDGNVRHTNSTTPVSIPRSGIPPRMYGNELFFRDEGRNEDDKSLWWLQLGDSAKLVSFKDDVQIVGPMGPRWENNFDYLMTPEGTLWICAGGREGSLIRRNADGKYEVAIVNGSLRWSGLQKDFFEQGDDSLRIFAAGLALRQGGDLLIVSPNGLYVLGGGAVRQLLAFRATGVPFEVPSKLFLLDDQQSYVLSDEFGCGVFLLERNNKGKYIFKRLDSRIGAPVQF